MVGEPDAILADMDEKVRDFIYESNTYEEEVEEFDKYANKKVDEEKEVKKNREYI